MLCHYPSPHIMPVIGRGFRTTSIVVSYKYVQKLMSLRRKPESS